MEFYRLNSEFKLDTQIDHQESLIWTERYINPGDFALKSSEIEKTLQLLPRGSTVAIRESTVPMIVEDYLLEHPKGQPPTITVTGRTYESVLDRRSSFALYPWSNLTERFKEWAVPADKPSDAAYLLMRAVLGDIARNEVGLPQWSPTMHQNDAIPQVNLVPPKDFVAGGSPVQPKHDVPKGDLLKAVLEMIAVNNHGLKATRPLSDDKSTIDIEIYNGANLTDSIVFDARYEQFEDTRYLMSDRSSSNVAYLLHPQGLDIHNKNSGIEPEGLSRRVLFVDEFGNGALNTAELQRGRALVELYKRNATASFDGEISTQVASDYNSKYFLGDIVTLFGAYGISEQARISEFIRTQDSTGTKAYPTLEVISE